MTLAPLALFWPQNLRHYSTYEVTEEHTTPLVLIHSTDHLHPLKVATRFATIDVLESTVDVR